VIRNNISNGSVPSHLTETTYIKCESIADCGKRITKLWGKKTNNPVVSNKILKDTYPDYIELGLFQKSVDKFMFSFYSSTGTVLRDTVEPITYELTMEELNFMINHYVEPSLREWYKTEYEPDNILTYKIALIALCASFFFPFLYIFFKTLKCFIVQKLPEQEVDNYYA
jgi:hypothetical protein